MTEQEMRASTVPWPKTLDELNSYIKTLSEQNHDYGTCVYAMSMAAVATFYYMSHVVGSTGFQAGCAELDFLRRTRGYERFFITNLADLMYPQYVDKFKNYGQLIAENAEWLVKEAKEMLSKSPNAHPDVISHWQMLSKLKIAPPKENKEGVAVQTGNSQSMQAGTKQ